ncbi:MAG: Oligopeptide transport ATP-binding protein OppF, partial [uncultured Acidimicrobiales bacterium]
IRVPLPNPLPEGPGGVRNRGAGAHRAWPGPSRRLPLRRVARRGQPVSIDPQPTVAPPM